MITSSMPLSLLRLSPKGSTRAGRGNHIDRIVQCVLQRTLNENNIGLLSRAEYYHQALE